MKARLRQSILVFLAVLMYATGAKATTKLGDANGDGTVNAADIVEVVNYIMGSPSNTFKADGADVNNDGIVNAADIVGIVTIIMNPPQDNVRYLVVWLNDGTSIPYALDDHPKTTFTTSGIIIKTDTIEDTYSTKDVRRFTYSSNN